MRRPVASPTRPLVSVLLPVFDAERTLDACLRSLQRQTETRWECVIVDDGSRDGTLARARAFAGRDARLRILERRHAGLVTALNAGLACCAGRFVARMDADDLMHRQRLAAQREALERSPELVAVGCHVRVFPRRALGAGLRSYERWLRSIDTPERVRREAFVECPLVHPTLMIRRERICALGYRELGWPEDYDLVLRLLGAGERIGVLPRRLLAWRDGPARLWRTGAAYRQESLVACKAAFLAEQRLARHSDYVLWGYGATGRALRRALLAHGKRPSHIVELHPRRLGRRIHGAPVIAPEALDRVPTRPLVVSVAGEGPRNEIRAWLAARGLEDPRDFVCAA